MTSRSLVSLAFLLALGLASAYVLDDTYPGIDTMEDMAEANMEEKMIDEMSSLDKIHDRSLPKEPVDEMSNLENLHDRSLPKESLVEEDIPASIKKEAKIRAITCSKAVRVPKRFQKKERQSALRKFYQAIQHGKKNFISDAKWLAAKKSEVCSACVLNALCKQTKIHNILKINASLPQRRKERICKRRILRRALDVMPMKAQNITCDKNARFRTIDGTCNNLQNPSNGAAGDKFERLVPADYGDCISTLRLSVRGKELPNARDVSRFVHGSNADRTNPSSSILTHLTMNFGQFMDHDITLAEAQGLNCEPPTNNSECINIDIPSDDAIFRDREVDFIELERDAPHEPASDCKLIPREHVNTLTAYIDASNVYGSTQELADSLRRPDGGLRDMKHPHGCPFENLKNLLPPQTEGFCPSKDPNRPCFVSGDERNNENQGLNSIHTLFVRHHNRIATYFGQKTEWDGERIYQEARKIIGAQLQVITYNEFLPLLLSSKRISDFNLKLLRGKTFFNGYNATVNAQMTTGFSVAAYRMGHSLIQEWFKRFSQDGFEHKCDHCNSQDKSEFLPIPVLDFGEPQYLYDVGQGGIDSIMRGLIKDPAGKLDGRFSSSVQENLFRGEGDLADLMAINIERGRERGQPGYTTYRNLALCGLKRVASFDDLEQVAGFDPTDVANLKKVYDNVRDIDLFTGGMLEPADPHGGVLGPTFQCVIAEQFKRLRVGDRFWHENAPDALLHTEQTAFTPCQLEQLRKTSLAKIICDNGDNIPKITRRVLQQSDIRVSCNDLPRVELEPWKPGFQCNNKKPGVVHDANDDHNEAHAEF